jgi:hypothetical protein
MPSISFDDALMKLSVVAVLLKLAFGSWLVRRGSQQYWLPGRPIAELDDAKVDHMSKMPVLLYGHPLRTACDLDRRTAAEVSARHR